MDSFCKNILVFIYYDARCRISIFLANLFLEPTKLGYLIIIILGVTVGILIYGTITIKTRLADEFLGEIPEKLRRRVRFYDENR